jgi:hypothetical protein
MTVENYESDCRLIRNDFRDNIICPPITVCTLPCEPAVSAPCNNPRKKKENNMGYNNSETRVNIQASSAPVRDPILEAKDHLSVRLNDMAYKKLPELRKAFGLVNDEDPKTPDELIQRIKDGKFVLPSTEDQEKNRERDFYSSAWSFIEWRDPSVKRDQSGYAAAKDKLNAAATQVRDIIMVKTPEDGLAALQAFEAQSFLPTTA